MTLCYIFAIIIGMNATYKPESLVVLRDGHIDDEYYDEIYQDRRRQALHAAGRNLVHLVARSPLEIGKGMIWLMTHDTSLVK